jgi:hypothetical protein
VLVSDRSSSPQGDLYWVQPSDGNGGIGPVDRLSGSEWGVHVNLGAPRMWFDVVVVLADSGASDYFTAWQTNGKKATEAGAQNPYPEIPSGSLPPGIEEKLRITAYRSQ